ncbi:MAG: DUF4054 domain-containing protein [Opitutaceae bacterium]|jgi:hypothetical protein|nr:DUF4054 domain-containing protein [Opitutaceae bacterium]
MAFTQPDADAFRSWFARDFPFAAAGDDPADLSKVREADIAKAFAEAKANFNPALFESQEAFATAFLYAAAHYLVHDLKNAAQGVSGSYTWLVNSRSVGGVSESYAIPDAILKSPALSFFGTTGYGMKYLSLIAPRLIGNVCAFQGATWP